MTRLADLWIADAPERWEALGFSVSDGVVALGGVTLRLGAEGRGIVAWAIEGVAPGEIDGLRTEAASPPAQPEDHANGAIGLDHVVITTPDFDRTRKALENAAMPLSRVDGTMGFKRLGPAILELVQASDPAHPEGPARFWGLVVVVGDLEALARAARRPPRGHQKGCSARAKDRDTAPLGRAVRSRRLHGSGAVIRARYAGRCAAVSVQSSRP